MKLTPILGEKHNTFTLIDIEPQEKQHNANGVWYKFECECGEVRIHLLTKIRRGIIKSCGCQNTGGKPHDYLCNYCGEKDSTKFTGNYKHTCRECVNKDKAEYTKTHIRALLSSKAAKFKRQKSKKPDDVPLVDLDYLEKLWEKQERLCFYTNVPMTLNNKDLRSVSVDRVDSDFGYIEGNIVLCCKGINLMKSSASWKETSLFLKDVSDNIDESQMLGEEWDLP